MLSRLSFSPCSIADVDLGPNRFLRLDGAKDAHIHALSGTVLITFMDTANDMELHAGETAVVPNSGLALVEGIGECRIRLQYFRAPLRAQFMQPLLHFALPRAVKWCSDGTICSRCAS